MDLEDASEPIQGSFDEAHITLALIDNAISQRNHEVLQSRELSRPSLLKAFQRKISTTLS